MSQFDGQVGPLEEERSWRILDDECDPWLGGDGQEDDDQEETIGKEKLVGKIHIA